MNAAELKALPENELSDWIARHNEQKPDYVPQMIGSLGSGGGPFFDRAVVTEWWRYNFGTKEWDARSYKEPEVAIRLMYRCINGLMCDVTFIADGWYEQGIIERSIAESFAHNAGMCV